MKKKEKKELFSNIIGYDDVKNTLKMLLNVLKDYSKYEKMGVNYPKGLFLYGPPGTGKTSFSKEFIENLDRKSYIVRKTKSNGNFIDYLAEIFNDAKNNQPAVILLDDIDKFAEDERIYNSEEFVAVQSLIDEVKNLDIFIIATANNERVLPTSLLRSGRFDTKIEINNPSDEDSYNIINYYLHTKKISKNVNVKNISYILKGYSCADLEKVCNQAGIYATYNNNECIEMDDIVRASLEKVYDTNIQDINDDDKYLLNTAYHEAGHAIIGQLLEPQSILFITVAKNKSNINGFTIYNNDENYFHDIKFMENRIKMLLAGRAAIEVVFGKCDCGASSDLQRAFKIASRFIGDYCIYGFDAYINEYDYISDKTKEKMALKTSELLNSYYIEVKEMLIKNKDKLDLLAHELKSKKILFYNEINELFNC